MFIHLRQNPFSLSSKSIRQFDAINRVDSETWNARISNHRNWIIYALTNETSLCARHAYLDTRDNNHGSWHIRVYAVLFGKAITGRGKLICQLQIKSSNKGYHDSRFAAEAFVYERSMKEITIEGRKAHRALISCRTPRNIFVDSVVISANDPQSSLPSPHNGDFENATSGQVEYNLPVKLINVSKSMPQTFGICVPLAYGNFSDKDAVKLIEWVELHRMFGVSEVNIYNVSMNASDGFRKVLNYFIDRKIIRLFQIPPLIKTFEMENIYNISKIADLIVLNECMMDNINRYKRILVIDFDEVMVPRDGSDSLHSAIENVYGDTKSQNLASYLVHSVFFYRNLGPSVSEPKYLSTMRHILRWGSKTDYTNPKQITDPRKCVHVYMHYCDQVFSKDDLYNPGYNLGYVHPKKLLVHHYRKSCGATWRPGVRYEDEIYKSRCSKVLPAVRQNATKLTDRYMLRYKDKLDFKMREVMNKLRLWSALYKLNV